MKYFDLIVMKNKASVEAQVGCLLTLLSHKVARTLMPVELHGYGTSVRSIRPEKDPFQFRVETIVIHR